VTPCISAVQHLRRLRGGSQSHLLRASDGNPQHIRVLANEMLATRLPSSTSVLISKLPGVKFGVSG
jgi:3-methyladenine DNA glycosylase AlkC